VIEDRKRAIAVIRLRIDWHITCMLYYKKEAKMKNGLWIISLVFLLVTSCSAYISSPETSYSPDMVGQYGNDPQQYGADMNMDMDSMYNYLAPYGNWINMNPYGYVWVPRHMGYQWRPYSNGHWVMTEDGWTWIANEEWGEIPFHYGRWGYDDYIGWYWVPGTTWGPAWVSWRWSDQYAGWAPLQPGIEFRANMDFDSLSINIPNRFWVFLQASRFLDRDIYHYTLPYERNASLINFTNNRNNMNFRNNRIFNEGIKIDVVRRVTRREVPQYKIQNVRQPGRDRIAGKTLQVFRPNLRASNGAKPKVFLNTDEARKELAPVKVFEPRQQVALNAQAAAVRKRQAEEKALLEKTQAQDLKNIQRQRNAELMKVRDATEKAKIKQDNQNKIAELQKQHQAEKLQLIERHKQDTELVKQQVALNAQKVQQARKTNQAPVVKKKKKD
jgi:hypothetical protein